MSEEQTLQIQQECKNQPCRDLTHNAEVALTNVAANAMYDEPVSQVLN
ncbi:hypothetical protein [Pantoea sp. X85]|nr:hypothetical protein [Pantoea sp. X85]WFL66608.1 hypothetical protein P6287_14720 [Pantoea sp. X85]